MDGTEEERNIIERLDGAKRMGVLGVTAKIG